jgi:hypothetical protein
MQPCAKNCGRQIARATDRYCRECRNEYNRKWRRDNKDKRDGYQRAWLDGQKARGGCRKCACEFSVALCLLHYLARRAKYALGKETVAGARVLMEVFERQQGRCPYTGRVLTFGMAQIDHVDPRVNSGAEALRADNIEWVHPDVNRAKSGLGREDFLALCRDIAAWTTEQAATA